MENNHQEKSMMKLIYTILIVFSLAGVTSVFANSDYHRPDHKIIQPVKCETAGRHECNVHNYCSWNSNKHKCKRVCASYKISKGCKNDETCHWIQNLDGDSYCIDREKLG